MIAECILAILHDTCHHQQGFATRPLYPWTASHPSVFVSVDPSTYPSGSRCHLIEYNRPECNGKYDDRIIVEEMSTDVLREMQVGKLREKRRNGQEI